MRRGRDRPLRSEPWFESNQLEADLGAMDLDTEALDFVRAMAREGGALIDLGDEARVLCDRAVADTDGYFEVEGIGRVQDAWYRSAAVRRLATSAKLHRLLSLAWGRRSFAFQTINFKHGTEQPLHSDSIHFSSVPPRFMCGVWIALEDVTADSGPLSYFPGSHRLPILTMRGAGVNEAIAHPDEYYLTYLPRLAEQVDAGGFPEKRLVIPKGWALVWAANLAHGGSEVASPQATRRSLVVHCYFEDCLYFTPLQSDVEGDDLSLRLPPEVGGAPWRWPRREGRREPLPWTVLLSALKREIRRKPRPGE